jgi:hypothetical protein
MFFPSLPKEKLSLLHQPEEDGPERWAHAAVDDEVDARVERDE